MSATTNPESLSRPLSAILLPILATIACILCLPILVNHIKSRNLATSVLISWIVLENVYNLVNPLLWPTNDFGRWWDGVGLCDVESKLRLAGYMGYASALVCIYRQLALILNTEQIVLVPSPAQRRRRIAIEIALCFGAPIYIMVAHFIVQSGRYYVFAITGCVPILDSSWPSIVLVLIWPGIMWLVAAAYCSIIIHRLIKYRRHVSGILSGPHSRYNQSQFTRVFAMATALILIFLPLALYILVQNLSYNGVRNPYSWSRTHDWSNSTFFMPSSSGENFGRWIEVVTGFVVFVSLGLSRDGLLMYRRLLLKVGLGRIFPRLRFSYCQEPSKVDISPPFPCRFTICADYELKHGRLRPKSDCGLGEGHTYDMTPSQNAHRAESVQLPFSATKSAHWTPFYWRGNNVAWVPHRQDEDVRMASLLQAFSPIRFGSTRSSAPSRVNQGVITVLREFEQSEIFQMA